MKESKETVLAGILNEEELHEILTNTCDTLGIKLMPFEFKNSIRIISSNYWHHIPDLFMIDLTNETMTDLAIMILEDSVDILQETKWRKGIYRDIKHNKFYVLINPSITYTSHEDPEWNDTTLEYTITSELKIEFDSMSNAYNFALSHIFDDAFMDAKLDYAYKIEKDSSDSNSDYNSYDEEDASHL